MFVTGPDVVKTVTHEEVTHEELGGAVTAHDASPASPTRVRERRRGAAMRPRLVQLPAPLEQPREAAGLATEDPADRMSTSLDTLVPDNPNKPYDIKELILKVVDDGDFFEIQPEYAKNIVVGFARMAGRRSASSPTSRWCWPAASTSRARSRRALRALLRLLQHPAGHLRRRARASCRDAQEYGGIIKHGAKLLYAYAEATVPKVTVITRKAYGGAYDVMSSKHLRGDVNFAWPTAEIAVMGPKGAVEIIFRKDQGDPAEDGRAHRRVPAEVRQPVHRRRSAATSTT